MDEEPLVPARTSLEPPSGAELAAVTAAVEALWPRPVAAADRDDQALPAWRFSGRWWARPATVRRQRPWIG